MNNIALADDYTFVPTGSGGLDALHSYAIDTGFPDDPPKNPAEGYGHQGGGQRAFLPWNGVGFREWWARRNASQLAYKAFTEVDTAAPDVSGTDYTAGHFDTRKPNTNPFPRVTSRTPAPIWRQTRPFDQSYERHLSGEHFSMERGREDTRRPTIRQRPMQRFSTLDHAALPPNDDRMVYQGSGSASYIESNIW